MLSTLVLWASHIWSALTYILSVLLPGFDSIPKDMLTGISEPEASLEGGTGTSNSEIQIDGQSVDFFALVVPDWLFDKEAKNSPGEKSFREDPKHRHYWSCERKVLLIACISADHSLTQLR